MKITVAYIVVTQGADTYEHIARFVGSWLVNPPGVDVKLLAVCNGGPLNNDLACLFAPMTMAAKPFEFFHRPNDPGKDMSAYQSVAQREKCDMLVCFGESVHFHREGWLLPFVDAWEQFGPGFYGFFSSHLVRPHMNTTAFAIDPKFLSLYPKIKTGPDRYQAEHGTNSIWKSLASKHIPTAFVTWDNVWPPGTWRDGENIMWRGDQSNLIVWCNHTSRWFAADAETRFRWSAGADANFELVVKP